MDAETGPETGRSGDELERALEDMRKRQAEISALLASSRALLEHREFPPTARAIFQSCKELIGATAGYVALLSEDGSENELIYLDPGGLDCTVDPSLPMPIRGLRADTYSSGRAVYDNAFRTSAYARFLPEGHATLENVLFAPLFISGKAVGLLGLANKEGGFNDDDARLASALGELAAVALRNSRTLELLETSEEHFRSVADTASDGIITVDHSGKIVYWNQGAEAIFGYPAAQVLGKLLAVIMPERFHGQHRKAFECAVSSGRLALGGRTVELIGLRKDGAEFPLELSLSHWETSKGLFFTSIVRDTTDRKAAEDALHEAHRRTVGILESITDAFFALDQDWRFTYVNGEAERLLQRSREQLIGNNVWDEFPEAVRSTFYEQYHKSVREQTPVAFEEFYPPLDTWFEVRAYPSQGGVSVYFRDISYRKRMEQALEQAYEREHRIADVLQHALLPEVDSKEAGYEIAAQYRPALKDAEVGGDLYDVFDLGDGRLGLVMGDVSGKGLEAAVYTAMVKDSVRAYAYEDPRPAHVLRRLNAVATAFTPASLFITVFYGMLDTAAGVLAYAGAGHDEPLVYRGETGEVQSLTSTGPAIGVLQSAEYGQNMETLSPGDILLVYTDGITEARKGGSLFGRERLAETLAASAGRSAREIVDAVLEVALTFASGDLRDDAAVLVVKAE